MLNNGVAKVLPVQSYGLMALRDGLTITSRYAITCINPDRMIVGGAKSNPQTS